VALEQTRAALLWQLSKYEQLHLYVVPPQTSAQFRILPEPRMITVTRS
jgi:hypothetical protein